MEANRIEVSELLRACHGKSDIAEILNINRMTVIEFAKRHENLNQDCPRSGRSLVIKRETVKKAFENDPTLKMRKFAQRKMISVSTVSRAIKNGGGKSLRLLKKPLLNLLMIQNRLERSTRFLNDMKNYEIESSFFPMRRGLRSIQSSTSRTQHLVKTFLKSARCQQRSILRL